MTRLRLEPDFTNKIKLVRIADRQHESAQFRVRPRRAKSNKKMTLEDLAALTTNEISRLEEKLTKEIRSTRDELKSGISDVKANLNKKVDNFTHKSLEFRVEKLEEKAGATRKK